MKTKESLVWRLPAKLFDITAYLLWLVNMLACVAAIIQLQAAVTGLWIMLGGDRYTLTLANQVCLLLSSFTAFVYVMFLEGYYRESRTPRLRMSVALDVAITPLPSQPLARLANWWSTPGLGALLRRFSMTTAIPLVVHLLSLGLLKIALYIFV